MSIPYLGFFEPKIILIIPVIIILNFRKLVLE